MKKLIAIVGMSGTGKSVVTDYLATLNFQKIYFGGVVLDKIKELGLADTPENEKVIREELRNKLGMGAMAIELLPKIEESYKKGNTVLDGLYSWDEYLILKDSFKHLKLLSVVTDKNVRYQRVSERKVRPLTNKEVEKRDYAELENLKKGAPIAFGDYFILNNGSKEDLKKQVDRILKEMDVK